MMVAVLLGFVVAPTLALAIEIGRYEETRTLIQQAADLAALAGAQEADAAAFQETGSQVLLPTAQGVAQDYINRNLTLAGSRRITVAVRAISIQGNVAACDMDADVSELFPRFVGHVTIRVTGMAEMRFTRNGQYLP